MISRALGTKVVYATSPSMLLRGFVGPATPQNVKGLGARFGLSEEVVARGLAERPSPPHTPSHAAGLSQYERMQRARRYRQIADLCLKYGFPINRAERIVGGLSDRRR
jgi:hypothetical protein